MSSGFDLRVGTNSKSGIAQVQLSHELVLDGQRVVLIEAPGFGNVTLSDTEVLKLYYCASDNDVRSTIHLLILSI